MDEVLRTYFEELILRLSEGGVSEDELIELNAFSSELDLMCAKYVSAMRQGYRLLLRNAEVLRERTVGTDGENITEHEWEVIRAYRAHPAVRKSVDEALGISPETQEDESCPCL